MAENNKYNDGRWSVPNKRAKGYAEERRAKVHKWGPKEGRELTTYEQGIRSGYLQCQNDHAGIYKYKKALAEGKSKSEAIAISRRKMAKEAVKDAKEALKEAKKAAKEAR